ncbi:hypothetical protein GALMADRAFT_72352 [Galerina marginata CBS 339.88]|uniref:F-box domain-containing protein n=1 Tax=Galerina marginata (strain CBS 339.88) TaxID=685588 RepID=A0A067SRI6_GALM3|nr:hypothetical protein GALMADRAFT_72352 [Galerina marginata CBS 339.88]
MSSTSVFPLEIQEIIINTLAEDDDGHLTLKTCSLLCQAFLPMCRKHIFASVILNDHDAPSPTTHALERLLVKRPEIADYIRKLDYNVLVADLASPTIQESLQRISRLESFTVRHARRPKLDWSNNPIRPALLHLLQLPTLTHFKLSGINEFVVSDLIPCINLKYLDIGIHTTVSIETAFPAVLPEHTIQLNGFVAGIGTATAIVKICTALRPDGQPIVDFGSLSKIAVTIEKPDEGVASQELFRHCQKLTDVQLSLWDPRQVKPNFADILRPSMQTLKCIVVDIHVEDDDNDPLFGIPSELEDMHAKSIIESIFIKVLVQTDGSCSRGNDWGRLDEVLTSSGWSALKRVSLAIEIARSGRSDNELEVALLNLPETQFPRLSASNSVSFEFEVNTVLV